MARAKTNSINCRFVSHYNIEKKTNKTAKQKKYKTGLKSCERILQNSARFEKTGMLWYQQEFHCGKILHEAYFLPESLFIYLFFSEIVKTKTCKFNFLALWQKIDDIFKSLTWYCSVFFKKNLSRHHVSKTPTTTDTQKQDVFVWFFKNLETKEQYYLR